MSSLKNSPRTPKIFCAASVCPFAPCVVHGDIGFSSAKTYDIEVGCRDRTATKKFPPARISKPSRRARRDPL